MKKLTESGWKKVDAESIKEEDIRALFDMIDKDRSGSLSKRVTRLQVLLTNTFTCYLPGGQESCKVDQRQIWF